MKTKEQILAELPNFYGTEAYHQWSMIARNFVLTDGAKYIAEVCGAYWLMDVIASHVSAYRSEGFALVQLTKEGDGCTIVISDGNDNTLAEQAIEFTDFPLDELKLYVVHGDYWIIMLPSEY